MIINYLNLIYLSLLKLSLLNQISVENTKLNDLLVSHYKNNEINKRTYLIISKLINESNTILFSNMYQHGKLYKLIQVLNKLIDNYLDFYNQKSELNKQYENEIYNFEEELIYYNAMFKDNGSSYSTIDEYLFNSKICYEPSDNTKELVNSFIGYESCKNIFKVSKPKQPKERKNFKYSKQDNNINLSFC